MTMMKSLLNHTERAKEGATLILRTTAEVLVAVCKSVRRQKRGRETLLEKKTLTDIMTMMKSLLNHTERAKEGAILIPRTTAEVLIAVCTYLR
jgi:hypothetical protein